MKNARWYKPTLYANEENITLSHDDISSTHALKILNLKYTRLIDDQKIPKKNQNIHRTNHRDEKGSKLDYRSVKKPINRGERGHFHHCCLTKLKNRKKSLPSITHLESYDG